MPISHSRQKSASDGQRLGGVGFERAELSRSRAATGVYGPLGHVPKKPAPDLIRGWAPVLRKKRRQCKRALSRLPSVGLPEIGVQCGGFILEQRSDHGHRTLAGREHDARQGRGQRRVLGMRTGLPLEIALALAIDDATDFSAQ